MTLNSTKNRMNMNGQFSDQFKMVKGNKELDTI